MIELSNRLGQIARMVQPGSVVADIGTDHGQLMAYLAQNGIIRHGYACDINEKPLNKARQILADHGLDDRVDCVLASGLDGLAPGSVDTVVIAGMGGDLTARILDAAPWIREHRTRLLLQPMTKVELLRGWLRENGYICTEERLVQDKGKLYVILSVTGGPSGEASDEERYGGFCLEHDPLYGLYLEQQLRRLYLRMDGLHRGGDESEAEPLAALADILEKKKEAWQRGNGQ